MQGLNNATSVLDTVRSVNIQTRHVDRPGKRQRIAGLQQVKMNKSKELSERGNSDTHDCSALKGPGRYICMAYSLPGRMSLSKMNEIAPALCPNCNRGAGGGGDEIRAVHKTGEPSHDAGRR